MRIARLSRAVNLDMQRDTLWTEAFEVPDFCILKLELQLLNNVIVRSDLNFVSQTDVYL